MLTNLIFEAFSKYLALNQNVGIFSIDEAHEFERELNTARIAFEDALSNQLMQLEREKQIELLTQTLTLFDKRASNYKSQPLYQWGDLENMSAPFMQWIREPNESADVKAFRDDFEQRLLTEPEYNVDIQLARLGKRQGKRANDLLRLVIDHVPGTYDEVEEIDFDDDKSSWIEHGLITKVIIETQGNVLGQLESFIGKSNTVQWIWSPDEWYDNYRESLGLPYLQRTFQNSYEAWHFYGNRHIFYSSPQEHSKRVLPQSNKPQIVSGLESTPPWEEIEALAERIKLRFRGKFVPANKWIAAATAGMIDALCEAKILPPSGELERLYSAFTQHYGRSIKADRVTHTRALWQKKARKELGLE